jgi:threonine synthase
VKVQDFPKDIQDYIIPRPSGKLIYRCLGCGQEYGIEKLLYTCPACRQVLLIYDTDRERLKATDGKIWRRIFDFRKMLTIPALKGIYLFHEFIGRVMPIESIIYLGEGHTPVIEANARMQDRVGARFYFKNDGQNPSASFKDRGMASALSYINYLIQQGHVSDVLAVCASTGDTSASAALYASYLQPASSRLCCSPTKKSPPSNWPSPWEAEPRCLRFLECLTIA